MTMNLKIYRLSCLLSYVLATSDNQATAGNSTFILKDNRMSVILHSTFTDDELAKFENISVGGFDGNFTKDVTSNISSVSRVVLFSTHRRQRRATAVDIATAGFNTLGIVVSLVNPVGGAVPLIIAALLPIIFNNGGGGDPKHAMQEIVWNERVELQKMKLISLRDTMKQIKEYAESHPAEGNERLKDFYFSISTSRCLFMHRDNIKSDAAYFREFVTIRLTVNLALIALFPDSPFWQNTLHDEAREYVLYASFAADEVRKLGSNMFELEEWIEKWSSMLPDCRKAELTNINAIKNNRAVSFRLLPFLTRFDLILDYGWLSCWGSGSKCRSRSCPSDNGNKPMERGPQYKYHWKCRGEVFRIEAIDHVSDGVIRSCSRIGIRYSHMHNKYWWLSYDGYTRPCPGENASSMRNGACDSEVWHIYAINRPCNSPIFDHDKITLKNKYGNSLSVFEWFTGANGMYTGGYSPQQPKHLTIYRSDVDHVDFYNDIPCT